MIPIQTQWVFLTGENGFGKTSVLLALLLGLAGDEEFPKKEIDDNTRVELVVSNIMNNNVEMSAYGGYGFTPFSYIAAYGSNRTTFIPSADKINVTDSLFGKTGYVLNFESRFKEMALFDEYKKDKQFIIDILKELIPNQKDIKVEKDKNVKGGAKVVYLEKSKEEEQFSPIDFESLAMGMRSIIGFVTDMIFRLSQNQELNNNLHGIVLIDEFDNHLHPKWQKELVTKLSNLFPNIQFIVSTHSPVPLLGAPPDKTVILNVDRTKEEGISINRLKKLEKELKFLLPNQLLTSDIFGLDQIESNFLNDDELEKVPVENKYDDIERNKRIKEDLKRRALNDDLFPDNLFNDNK